MDANGLSDSYCRVSIIPSNGGHVSLITNFDLALFTYVVQSICDVFRISIFSNFLECLIKMFKKYPFFFKDPYFCIPQNTTHWYILLPSLCIQHYFLSYQSPSGLIQFVLNFLKNNKIKRLFYARFVPYHLQQKCTKIGKKEISLYVQYLKSSQSILDFN